MNSNSESNNDSPAPRNVYNPYEDEDIEENKKYTEVLKKYFGYKSFRP